MDGDTENVWKDIEFRIDPDPFYTSCYISSMNKRLDPKNPLNPKAPFKWVLMDIISTTAPKRLTIETTFPDYFLFHDAYSKFPNL